MIISMHQPDYIPWLGYFYKINKTDIFVFLDDVQYSNTGMHNRNQIKTPQGKCFLTVPVAYRFGDLINQCITKDELNWKEKHLKTIEMNYKRAPHFKSFFDMFTEVISARYGNLADMNIEINKKICEYFGIKPRFVRSSELCINTTGTQRIIDICRLFDADVYYSGRGAMAYQKPEMFRDNGISLVYTDYSPFAYSQLWEGFADSLSVVDYIMNHGFKWPDNKNCEIMKGYG
ncbi:MAG: WbqC family protein [Clostridia bacterium]|nr:WbqC family protein [Clostridia bacterium]